jgi:hypothetical protein
MLVLLIGYGIWTKSGLFNTESLPMFINSIKNSPQVTNFLKTIPTSLFSTPSTMNQTNNNNNYNNVNNGYPSGMKQVINPMHKQEEQGYSSSSGRAGYGYTQQFYK